jgi:hypothetical protein
LSIHASSNGVTSFAFGQRHKISGWTMRESELAQSDLDAGYR